MKKFALGQHFFLDFFLGLLFLIFAAEISGTVLFAAEQVRVKMVGGTPTLCVDDRPAATRIFFGGPTRQKPVTLAAAWTDYQFEFTAADDSNQAGTLHLRPEHKPGTILFDDFSLVEVGTQKAIFADSFDTDASASGHWRVWPPESASIGEARIVESAGSDGSKAFKIQLNGPDEGKHWPDWHCYTLPTLTLQGGTRYRFSFKASAPDGHKLDFAFYRPGNSYTFLGSRDVKDLFAEQIRLAADAGVNLVSFPIVTPWPKPGDAVDFASVDASCRAVLAVNPNALLLPRIGLDPPVWWQEAHPDHIIQYDVHPVSGRSVAAVSSELYRREASEVLSRLVGHLEETFGPHMAGVHPCGQNTGEWFYESTWDDCYSGYAPTDQEAWRRWLAARYADDAALRRAWGVENVTCATAEVPASSERRGAKKGLFLDVGVGHAGQKLLDFAEFQQQMMVETVLTFARAARTASQGKRLVVIFYGYVFEFGAPVNGPAVSGHYALAQALASPDVDIFCSPISYHDRGKNGSAPAMTAAESVALAGKMWLYEDDTRTFLSEESNFPGWRDGSETCDGTRHLLRRNTAECAMRNFGTWWMDLGMSGWFNDVRLWDEMRSLAPVDRYFIEHPTPFLPEIAAFLDEKSALAVPNSRLCVSAFYQARTPLGRLGAPYGQYLLDDFLAGKTDAKLNVFLNPWLLSADRRRELAARTALTFALWTCGSGALDTEIGFSTDAVRELTGFRVERFDAADAAVDALTLTEAGRAFGLTKIWTPISKAAPGDPRFAICDVTPDETLAVWPDGRAAMALRKNSSGGASLLIGIPGLSSELLRAAAAASGAHLWTQTDCNVCANGSFVSLHAAGEGPVTVDFGAKCELFDLLTGEKIGEGPVAELPLAEGQTRVFECDRSANPLTGGRE